MGKSRRKASLTGMALSLLESKLHIELFREPFLRNTRRTDMVFTQA